MHTITDLNHLREVLGTIRKALEPAFTGDTALDQISGPIPSAGHCAAVAVLIRELLGGVFVSATVKGQSHWFNRLPVGSDVVDVDVTGDQFGLEPVRISPPGELYEASRVRALSEVHDETFARAEKLRRRAGLKPGLTENN